MSGLSPRNLLSMKLFAEAFPEGSIAKQAVSQLPWSHIIRLLQISKPNWPGTWETWNERKMIELEHALFASLDKTVQVQP